jgi:hypothetical protein
MVGTGAKRASVSASNSSLSAAKTAKQDEFYTQLADIEREMRHYKKHFVGKTVYLNCDDPHASNFFHYFSYNFEKLQLKKLIAACYKSEATDRFSSNDSEQAVYLEYEGNKTGSGVPDLSEIGIKQFVEDGDFRKAESIELLKQADIVVTNPPFSLFREYVTQLMEYDKKFIIIGPGGAITYKELFPLFQQNKIWLGNGFQAGNAYFKTAHASDDYAAGVYDPATGLVKFRNVTWFTNLDIAKRHEELVLWKTYSPDAYPKYDNFDAIEVGKTADIPVDYTGLMGVPTTFLDKHNPDQFEIVGITKTWFGMATKTYPTQVQVSGERRLNVGKLNDGAALKIDKPRAGKTYYEVGGQKFMQTYPRILIRRKGAQA